MDSVDCGDQLQMEDKGERNDRFLAWATTAGECYFLGAL